MMMCSSKRKSAMASCGAVASSKRKKGASVPGCAASLPEEMVTEVLLRLPVKSILRFRAVCRSWAALLSSEEFRSLHMATPKAAPPKLLLLSRTKGFDSTEVRSCSPSEPKHDLLFTLDCARGNFVEVLTPAPCRGLTLLYDAAAPAYYVCNAATRQVKRLPPFSATHRISTGLGFDARTKEYKVVRLINRNFSNGNFFKEMIKCEVYTLGGGYGDRWRPTTRGVPFGLRRFANAAVTNAAENKLQPVFANGFLHWLVSPSSFIRRPRASVVSFSITEEAFTCVRSPPFWASGVPLPSWSRASEEHLVELDNHLCMVRHLRNNPYGSTLEIWRLLDYSSGDWSLNHRIDLLGHVARELRDPQLVRVIGSIGNCRSGKKIIIATSEHWVHEKYRKKVHTYDPRYEALETILSTTETHTSRLYETPGSRFSLFEESLAQVRKADEELA